MLFRSKCNQFNISVLILLALWTWPVPASAREPVDMALLKGLEWRLVGPYRGGRVTTVTGVPGNPMLYYMGATGGGVWKTQNAGTTWENLSDDYFKVGTIGAVAVSASDNNVLYVGTGEAPIRGVTTSSGDGVWTSTDAGKTWTHAGLEKAARSHELKSIPPTPTSPSSPYRAKSGDRMKNAAFSAPPMAAKAGNMC